MVVFRIVSILLGYLFGLFPTGVLYGKAHNVDIRSKGSGNSGMTNSLRVLGWKAGVVVFFGVYSPDSSQFSFLGFEVCSSFSAR